MNRFFNKFGRLAAVVVVLAGVVAPQTAMAGGKHGGNGGGNHSQNFMKSSGRQFSSSMNSQPLSIKKFSSSSNFKRVSGNTPSTMQNLSSQKIKTMPSNVFNTGTFTPNVIKTGGITTGKTNKLGSKGSILISTMPVLNPFPGGKPPILIDPVLTPFPGGKPPVIKPPKGPFPGGKPPILTDPVLDPFPGGKPPKADPGQGGGGGGGNGGGNGNGSGGGSGPGNGTGGGNCHNKCPWPIFWPVYNGGNWNNSCYYGSGYNTPVYVNNAPPIVINDVSNSATSYGAARVDLVLEDVQLVEPATMLVGPAYRVKFRNQGLTAAGKFRVAVVAAVDGQASEQSPKTLVDVPGLASGEASEVTVRLPVSAMKLANANGQSTMFTHLLVAADFDNGISESDKANNVAVIERTMLEVPAAK